MKIGTLQCKLFGHKFVYNKRIKWYKEGWQFPEYFIKPIQTDFCVRCGKEKSPENTINIEYTKDNLERN